MGNPLISIIVPVFNVEDYLQNCINSILSQTYSNWELILVSDGSSDKCLEMCDGSAAKDIRIKVIHQRNQGVAVARNVGVGIAKGEYVTFLDSDDYLHPNCIWTLLNLSIDHSADITQCGLVSGTLSVFPELKEKRSIVILDNQTVFLKGYATVIVCAKLYKKYILEEIKISTSKFFEDDFTTWKWYYKAHEIVVTSEKLYYYTRNEHSTMAKHSKNPCLDFIEAYNERIVFFKNLKNRNLEDCSRAHLCKAMILSSLNANLSIEQRYIVQETFKNNWREIKQSPTLPFSLKVLFTMNSLAPGVTRKILKKLRK